MSLRVGDAQSFQFLTERSGVLQAKIRDLQEEIASGRQLLSLDQDPIAAKEALRARGSIAALDQHDKSIRFGLDVLGSQDDALGQAVQLMTRAEELATQYSSSITGSRDAAKEEVHGLLQALTVIGNTQFAGRRIFSGLANQTADPFDSPDGVGYNPATAYVTNGSTQEFELKTGSSSNERVRISTRGDTVFGSSLQALSDLEQALSTPTGDVAGTLSALGSARDDLGAERASVGARQSQLQDRLNLVQSQTVREKGSLSRVQDADLTVVITQLTQVQTALQATLAVGAQAAQTSLVRLLSL